jgi:hypothetical protein
MAIGKKKSFGIFLLLVIVAAAGYTGFVSKTWVKTVSIPYSMLKTGEQVNNAVNLIKWFRPFAYCIRGLFPAGIAGQYDRIRPEILKRK